MPYGKAVYLRAEIAQSKRAIAMNRHFEPAYRTLSWRLGAIGKHSDAEVVQQGQKAQRMHETKKFCDTNNTYQRK